MKTINLSTLFFLILLVSCNKEEQQITKTGFAKEGNIIVVNEGSFGSNNGSISYIDLETNTTSNNIFENINSGESLGDVIQSYYTDGDIGVIVANNSNKITVVDVSTFKKKNSSTSVNLPYPRYTKIINNKIYLTCWDTDSCLKILDKNSLQILKQIEIATGAEKMLQIGNKLYITNSGGFGNDNKVSVLNLDNDSKITDILVGDAPNDIVVDKFNNLWVLCSGQFDYSAFPDYNRVSEAKLVKINLTTNTVLNSYTLIPNSSLSSASQLEVSADGQRVLYMIDGKVYQKNVSDDNIPTNSTFASSYLYGLNVNPKSGDIWVTNSSFSANGYAYRYSALGTKIDSFRVGIGPSMVWFNE
jgi:YVTN family beta-propeller protein